VLLLYKGIALQNKQQSGKTKNQTFRFSALVFQMLAKEVHCIEVDGALLQSACCWLVAFPQVVLTYGN